MRSKERWIARSLIAVMCATLMACGGTGDGSDAGGSGSGEVAPPPPPRPKRYKAPRLEIAELGETLYYPLDTCVVSGKKLLPNCHAEVFPEKGKKRGRLLMLYNQHQVAAAKKNLAKHFATVETAYRETQRKRYLELISKCPVTGEPLGGDGERPYEFLLDPREEYVQVLNNNMRYLKYRYTVAWRLVIVKDAKAAGEFRRIAQQVVNKKTGKTRPVLPIGASAMDKINQAYIKAQFDAFKKRFAKGTQIPCVVNGRPLGRRFEDPETGGYRVYLHHDKLLIVCCKSCMQDIRTAFVFQLRGWSWLASMSEDDISHRGRKRFKPPE